MNDIYSKAVMTVIAVALSAALSVGASAFDAANDYCPELLRADVKPYGVGSPTGLRECGPGCIDEAEFTVASALVVLQAIEKDLTRNELIPDAWERDIERTAHLTILEGAMLRYELTHALKEEYEGARSNYCSFLKNRAYYLD